MHIYIYPYIYIYVYICIYIRICVYIFIGINIINTNPRISSTHAHRPAQGFEAGGSKDGSALVLLDGCLVLLVLFVRGQV